jgi:hypothetical protein
VEGEGNVRWSMLPSTSLPHPLLPDRDGEEVRHIVEEEAKINQPRLRKEQGNIPYLRVKSSTDGCWPPPSGIDRFALARLLI